MNSIATRMIGLRLAAAAAVLTALPGCGAFSGLRPGVVSSFPSVVSVTSYAGQGRALAIAQNECTRHKREARLAAGAYPDYTYYCLEQR